MPSPSPLRRLFSFALAAIACACASPTLEIPQVGRGELMQRTAQAQLDAITSAISLHAEAHAVAWPVLRDNADLCPDRTRGAAGWLIADVKRLDSMVDGLTRQRLRELGYDRGMRVLALMPDSPAGDAGVEVGDVVIAVADKDIADASSGEIGSLISETADKHGVVTMQLLRAGQERTVILDPVPVCDAEFVVDRSSRVQAFTDGERIVVTEGLIRLVDDDRLVAFVISHELAHIIGEHVRKRVQNAALSGAIVYGPILAIPAVIGDQALALAQVKPQRPPLTTALSQVTAKAMRSEEFEREADYLGLYLYARTGADLSDLEEIWRIFGETRPLNTWSAITHPTTPDRFLALQAARDEIKAKQAAGAPLMPQGWVMDDLDGSE